METLGFSHGLAIPASAKHIAPSSSCPSRGMRTRPPPQSPSAVCNQTERLGPALLSPFLEKLNPSRTSDCKLSTQSPHDIKTLCSPSIAIHRSLFLFGGLGAGLFCSPAAQKDTQIQDQRGSGAPSFSRVQGLPSPQPWKPVQKERQALPRARIHSRTQPQRTRPVHSLGCLTSNTMHEVRLSHEYFAEAVGIKFQD